MAKKIEDVCSIQFLAEESEIIRRVEHALKNEDLDEAIVALWKLYYWTRRALSGVLVNNADVDYESSRSNPFGPSEQKLPELMKRIKETNPWETEPNPRQLKKQKKPWRI